MNLTDTNRLGFYDWRAKAAAMTASDDNDVEKAFMDQAYGWVANKAGQLMQDPNRLGFEIVDKNDTNTRMVGIFAFRINKDLLYVPVFFLNGEIKGTDLLYQCKTKSFKPLNKGWVTFLLEKGDQNDGKGIDKDQRRFMPQDVRFDALASPPSGSAKAASEEMLKAAGYNSWDEWMDDAAKLTEPEPVLRRFMVEDGGLAALNLIEKAATESYEFANALVSRFDEDTYAPAELTDLTKQASDEAQLTLVCGALPEGVKAASADPGFFKRGFMLLDDRDEVKHELTTVMDDDTNNLQQFCGPGLYDVLMLDGSTEKAFVAYLTSKDFESQHGVPMSADCCGVNPAYDCDIPKTEAIVVLKNGQHKLCKDILGNQLKDIKECIKDGELLDSMEAGSTYRIFNAGEGTLSRPVYIKSKSKNKDITIYSAYPQWSEMIMLRHNPDFDGCDIDKSTLGTQAKFIKVKTEATKAEHCDEYRFEDDSKFAVGSHDTLDTWIRASGAKKASVRKGVDGFYTIRIGEKTASFDMTAPGMAAYLASALFIPGDKAVAIMDKAASDKRCDVWLMGKSAAALKLMQEPNFQTSYSAAFGTEVENPQSFALPVEGNREVVPESRIGDAWDPKSADGLPGNVLSEEQPEALQQLAAMHKLPHVFEHGVVGSLTKTFDSVAMIDKYLPDMEKALDSMGRIIFLFYWKPSEFEDAYGSDDMSNLENELLSNFKQFGDMVLNLTKKSKIRRNGEAPMLNAQ